MRINFILHLFIFFIVSAMSEHHIHAAATFPINFNVPNSSVTAAKFTSLGATTGQILKYNGTTWVASDLGSLTYRGSWNATTNTPDISSGGSLGDYYIVGTSGTHDLSGGPGTNSWNVGDWVIWNENLNRFDKIDNATSVTSFNGRSGAIIPMSNDYTWNQIDKTTSSLSDIADIDATGVTTNKVLKYNGTNWIIGDDDISGGAGTVDGNLIADDSIVDADINSAAAVAQTKISNLTTDLASKLDLSGGTLTGDLDMGSQNMTNVGTMNGLTLSTINTNVSNNTTNISTNTTALSGKQDAITAAATTTYYRGDKTFVNLDSAAVIESTNLYFTDARARSASVINSTTGTETDQAPSVSALKSYVSGQSAAGGNFLADGTVAMTGDFDMGGRNIASVSTITATGSVTMGNDVSTCDSASNGKVKAVNNIMQFCNGSTWQAVELRPRGSHLSISPSSKTDMDLTGGSSPGSYETFTVTNTGSLNSTTMTTSLSNSTNFELGTDNCDGTTLAIGASCTLQLRAKTSADGPYSTNLTVAADTSTVSAISGTASGFVVFGQTSYTTPGTYSWTVPAGVTSVSVVAVGGGGGGNLYHSNYNTGGGGGGLAYKNNITVTPGSSITITVGAGGVGSSGSSGTPGSDGGTSSFGSHFSATGGKGAVTNNSGSNGLGGSPVNADGGGNGGRGGQPTVASGSDVAGGGGAGGYSGNGGDGGYNGGSAAAISAQAGSGGAGGGGIQFAGGGVGIMGEGASGGGGSGNSHLGLGGSGGDTATGGAGGNYGAGAGYNQTGGPGAVRIIWPGNLRAFPSTRTADE